MTRARSTAVLLVLAVASIAGAVATEPAEHARLDRGVHVRNILLGGLEESFLHDGNWPDRLGVAGSIVYLKPGKVEDRVAATTVVVHEPIEANPDGVWVGYADGHLEFAPDAAALAECEDQAKILRDPATIAGEGEKCRVVGDVTSVGLYEAGRALTRVHAYAFRPSEPDKRLLTSDFNSAKFEFSLPPGDWGIAADGSDCDYAYRYIHINAGETSRVLHIDIPAYAFTALFGKAAPELRGIKAWKNGGPITLSSLRGKVVLLDFWGYWCPPCISGMPALMKLNDEFSPKGLVIIGVHDDSAESIEDLDAKLAAARQRVGGRREIPFLVALDGGGETRIARTPMTVRGTTTAAYGILKYPTTLLIGRDGKLVGEIDAASPAARAEIQKLLEE